VIGGKGETRTVHTERSQSSEDLAAEQERRFQEMRSRLLAQDARID
jgi:hypothetical protein